MSIIKDHRHSDANALSRMPEDFRNKHFLPLQCHYDSKYNLEFYVFSVYFCNFVSE